jgi:hypothetical protein
MGVLYYMATTDRRDELQPKSIAYLKSLLRELPERQRYSIVYNPKHIFESRLPEFFPEDVLLWHPNVAADNLDIVGRHHSYVLLMNRTIYIQKLSMRNPVNENMAMNNDFKLLYIDEAFSDITNDNYKLAVPDDDFRITKERFMELFAKT